MRETLTEKLAEQFAAVTLANITREYPNALAQVLNGPDELLSPRQLHPIFFGSFDWHSCVHGYWQLARLLRLFPKLRAAGAIRRQLDLALTEDRVRGEMEYFLRPWAQNFERPYGWAWLLHLATELGKLPDAQYGQWRQALLPLARLVAGRLAEFLPKATYPCRVGVHGNSAFALTLAHTYAVASGDEILRGRIETKAVSWYGKDVNCQAWEPSFNDFFSPALMEAVCMQRTLPAGEFDGWLNRFLPGLREKEPASLFSPVVPTDRTDGQIAHLDGLNFSRAWCMNTLAAAMAPGDRRRPVLLMSAIEHIAQSLGHINDDYAGGHWLATYLMLALTGD